MVLATVFLEGAFLYGAFAFFVAHLHQHFGIALASAGSVVMLFGFGGLLFAIASATLVRRLGEVGLTSVGGVLLAASLLAVGLAPAWWWALPGCFAAGLGFYMLHNTLQINATQMAPDSRGTSVALFASPFFLGQSSGVALAGLAVERLDTTPVMLAGAVVLLIVGSAFAWMRRHRDG